MSSGSQNRAKPIVAIALMSVLIVFAYFIVEHQGRSQFLLPTSRVGSTSHVEVGVKEFKQAILEA